MLWQEVIYVEVWAELLKGNLHTRGSVTQGLHLVSHDLFGFCWVVRD